MARSTYVYVLTTRDGAPMATCTVKHELVSYLRRSGKNLSVLLVARFNDGVIGDVPQWKHLGTAEEFLKDNTK